LLKCLTDTYKLEVNDKLQEFQSGSFGCRLTENLSNGNNFKFKFTCTPNEVADPKTYCEELSKWTYKIIPTPQKVFEGVLTGDANGSTVVEFNITPRGSVSFPQCKSITMGPYKLVR